MKPFSAFVLMVLTLAACQKQENSEPKSSWKNNPQNVISMDEAKSEISHKVQVVAEYLASEKKEGILLTQVRNVNWITAGLMNNQIVLNKDVGAASLLIMKDGRKYLICSGSEAGRMMDEGLRDLGYELLQYSWYESNPVKDVRGELIKTVAKGGTIVSDIAFPGTVLVSDSFKHFRYSLTETEIKRYRWLGKQATEAVVEVCKSIKPGMNEFEMEAMTSNALRDRGILPTVLLIAADDRISKYRHALPGGAVLKNYAMINIVAEKWGMPIAVTRFVHFGPLPSDLEKKYAHVAKVMTQYQLATIPGKACVDIFESCKTWYADEGYPNEWQRHHQGGATGYDDREYVIFPGTKEVVQNNQAFAWNPTITGSKIEDTFIAYTDHFEVVTKTDGWPMISVELNGKKYEQPGVLIR